MAIGAAIMSTAKASDPSKKHIWNRFLCKIIESQSIGEGVVVTHCLLLKHRAGEETVSTKLVWKQPTGLPKSLAGKLPEDLLGSWQGDWCTCWEALSQEVP